MRWPLVALAVCGLMWSACGEAFDEGKAREQLARDIDSLRARRGSVSYELHFVNRIPEDAITEGDTVPGSKVGALYWLTLYASGDPAKVRFDIRFGDEPSVIVILIKDEEEIICSSTSSDLFVDSLEQSTGACKDFEHVGENLAPVAFLLAPLLSQLIDSTDSSDVDISATHDVRLLDRDARCYRFSVALEAAARTNAGTEEWFSEDGIMVRFRTFGNVSQTFAYTATSVAEVSDADFEPPYPIVDPD